MSKYASAFDYIDKIFIVLGATTGGVCIIFHVTVVGAPVGIASAEFTTLFSLAIGIIKKLLKITKTKRKSMTKFLFWLKVNSIALKL